MNAGAQHLDFVLAADGRQSPAALELQRGASRLLASHGFAAVAELPLASGLRADIAALSEAGEIWIVEIKSCLADFRSDAKWAGYRDYCDRFFFAVAPDFPIDVLPEDAGLILADKYGGDVARAAPLAKLAPSRRKAMLVRLARCAAQRLLAARDPDFAREVQAFR